MEKKRLSNIELLRIICILLIIISHVYTHTDWNGKLTGVKSAETQILAVWPRVAVNCFVLITGYFNIASKYRVDKIIKLVKERWLYSILASSLAIICGGENKSEFYVEDNFSPFIL